MGKVTVCLCTWQLVACSLVFVPGIAVYSYVYVGCMDVIGWSYCNSQSAVIDYVLFNFQRRRKIYPCICLGIICVPV